MPDQQVVIHTREELNFLLCEASQLEHMLMCEYLFAAYSLKQETSEGLTPEQLEAVKRWERAISNVATQEMLHLATASNLLTAIGTLPFFYRPNFPQRSKYYPASVQLALLPFSEQALQHFLFLERPEDLAMQVKDAEGFDVIGIPGPVMQDDDIVSVAQDFNTVGQLYRSIEQGLRFLVDKYGEKQVFVGPAKAQASAQYFQWPELVTVTNLETALQAIDVVIEQGEGCKGDWQNAHYGKFLKVHDEFLEFRRQTPDFQPARPSTAAFVRTPHDVDQVTMITDPATAGVADMFNACYETLLNILTRFFVHGGESDGEFQTLCDTAINMMFVAIKPLGQLLATMPVGPHLPGRTAGATFEVYRTGYMLPHRYAAWVVMRERVLEIADYANRLGATYPALTTLPTVEQSLRQLVEALSKHMAE